MTLLVTRINQAIKLAGFHEEIKPKRKSTYIKTGKKRGREAVIPICDYDAIIERYKKGETLHAIGQYYGVSRERIRQIMKPYGITREHGGKTTQLFINSSAKLDIKRKSLEKRERKCQKYYGCSLEYRDSLGHPRDKSSATHKFKTQKNSAKSRGIEWNLTLKEWWDIWQEDGKWENRGIGSGKYVMARICDLGSYSIGNVQIITHNENSVESREMDKVRGTRKVSLYSQHKEQCEEIGISNQTFNARIAKGWSVEKACTYPVNKSVRWHGNEA